jgi:hypothetical protein
METNDQLEKRFALIWPHLDERARRLVAAQDAVRLGYGGVSRVSRACGLSRVTLTKGVKELRGNALSPGRIRRHGAGRQSLLAGDPTLLGALEALVEPLTRGDPESPLRWTCKSTRVLAQALSDQKRSVGHVKVSHFLNDLGYSLQGNRKTEEGDDHPDRDAQFRHINAQVLQAIKKGEPVISVDTKKKELVGNYENKGRQWRRSKSPIKVNGHDFPGPEVPRAYPYGIYDLGQNSGFVNVGTDHDTSTFAVASIRGWWRAEGSRLYPHAERLLITADGGGSNGYRLRLWKWELQRLADQTGLTLSIHHFPPGTSKWNKVEHRLFSFISSNWRGEPLLDYETVIRLIAGTTTAKGLKVTCRLDRRKYPVGCKVTDEEIASINMKPAKFHGEWNYVIRPREAS